MLEKICPVHNVPVYGEKCSKPGCYARPIVYTTIYWCDECNVPSFEPECSYCHSKCKYVATDLRPVFPEEKLLLGILWGYENPLELDNHSVWNSSSGYFIDGVKKELVIKEVNALPLSEIKIIKEKYEKLLPDINRTYIDSMVQRFVEVNKDRYFAITDEAINYIQSFQDEYSLDDMFVSFSGGKDSTVTSDLVTKAYSTNRVTHIYGDTTLEFESTEAYRCRFAESHRVLRAKNYEKNFEDLCETVGPPSRVMRWCCTVFKTGAITKKLEQVFGDKTNILTFYGIRKSESASRSKYDRESESPKITKQTVVSPIIEWIDFDIWLYILTTGIDFNEAYKLGYSRVGCWCCPNNGAWSEFLSKVHMFDKYEHWRNMLVGFAKKVGKPDAEEYVDSGAWKARQGGQGLEIANTSIIKFEPCATEDNAFNYELQNLITDDLYELFKPFGYINKELGNKRLGEVYVLDANGEVVLVLQGRIGTNRLKVTIKKTNIARANNLAAAEGKIKCQLTKYQMCLGCKACASVCKHNAITVHTFEREDDEQDLVYQIDDEKCVRCGHCVDHFTAGCYMRKVLCIKRGNLDED
ncbi:phosphoadenosine phosphosulfate reductase domain-containing protein [Pseudobutyrivibrio sp. LB2011]|uniref:phosphoadenosine phosphosulfate reductase domain-containing protein n=1 Tax=Pseudobutyrivibrio sp. LB2011 TaxID=1408312 RepID=UPI0009DFE9D7|nr:phosphoadenosine phosphosulfate reductase family protein [Pseudobutyrivibrio sp. LB2011]